jgi:hypothetical protein
VEHQTLRSHGQRPLSTTAQFSVSANSLAHQARDAMLAAGLAGLPQIEEDARGAVDAMTPDERGTNQPQQAGIAEATL